jgi:predicted ATPase
VCPHLHVLATSREPLAISGEIIWLVRPLQLPDPNVPLSASEITGLAAVQLFMERARAVNPPSTSPTTMPRQLPRCVSR